jgi:6-phosphogluconolactonase
MTPPPAGTELAAVDDVPTAFAELVAETFAARGGRRFTLVLSGGPTARACYERTAALAPGRVDWSLVDVYLGDERLVPPDDADANQRLVRESLIEPVGGVGSFHPMPTGDEPDRCAAAYQEVVAALLGGPGIDLIHLGLGPDGHTASLFAGSDALERPGDRLVMVSSDPHERNPHRRLTLTLRAIDQARVAVFTVAGASKSQALRRVLDGEDVPAARVRAKTVRWVVDPAAMGLDRQRAMAGPDGGLPGDGERRR